MDLRTDTLRSLSTLSSPQSKTERKYFEMHNVELLWELMQGLVKNSAGNEAALPRHKNISHHLLRKACLKIIPEIFVLSLSCSSCISGAGRIPTMFLWSGNRGRRMHHLGHNA